MLFDYRSLYKVTYKDGKGGFIEKVSTDSVEAKTDAETYFGKRFFWLDERTRGPSGIGDATGRSFGITGQRELVCVVSRISFVSMEETGWSQLETDYKVACERMR